MALLRQERRTSDPCFPLTLLRRPAMWRANGMAACSGALLVSESTILPIHLQAVDGVSAGHIGLLMLPLTATVSIGSIITGRLMSGTGRVAIFPAVGQTAAALGLVAVAFGGEAVGATFGPWGLPVMLAAVAVFQGSAMPVAQVTVQSLAPPAMLGAAAASVQLSRSVGSAVGVTLAVGVLFATVGWDAQGRGGLRRCRPARPRCPADHAQPSGFGRRRTLRGRLHSRLPDGGGVRSNERPARLDPAAPAALTRSEPIVMPGVPVPYHSTALLRGPPVVAR